MDINILNRRDFLASLSKTALACTFAGSVLGKATGNAGSGAQDTGYAFDEKFYQFGYNGGDVPQRVEWINRAVNETGLIDKVNKISPYAEYMEILTDIHTAEHISGIQSYDPDTGFKYGMGEIAELTVSYVLGAVRDVCNGTVRNAFCAIRPPGHHVVQHGYSTGYCCYANVVLAAHFARKKMGIDKVLIVDWDYHHGNSTQDFLCRHSSKHFPPGSSLFFETYASIVGSSSCGEIPDTAAFDFTKDNTINVELDCGWDGGSPPGNDDIEKIFRDRLVPAAQQVKPELVLISSGFDLKKWDSHGCFDITAKGVSQITKVVREIADTYAEGRIVSMLEGGYSDVGDGAGNCEYNTFYGLSSCACNHIATLLTNEIQPETDFYLNGPPNECTSSGRRRTAPRLNETILEGNMLLIQANGSAGISSIAIRTLQGRHIARIRITSDMGKINLNSYIAQSGKYMVSCTYGDGEVITLPWICRK